MIARKCDRCGKFFLPYMLDCNSRASEFYQIIEKVESIDCGGRGINKYDLCKDCRGSFKEWLRSSEKNK